MTNKFCLECPLKNKRTIVPYEGSFNAGLAFIGEAPTKEEEQHRPKPRPFVGKSGILLNKLFDYISIIRGVDAAILNALKCRIYKDEDSTKEINTAVQCCRGYLDRNLRKLKPKLIVCLGAYALKQIFNKQKIMQNRGRFIYSDEYQCWVFVTVHPAYVLRGCTKGYPDKPLEEMTMKERMLFMDFKLIRAFIDAGYVPPTIDTSKYTEGRTPDLALFNRTKNVCIDYEANHARVHLPDFKLISQSFSIQEGESKIFFPDKKGKMQKGVDRIMDNPNVSKIVTARPFEESVYQRVTGKKVQGKVHDILQLAHLLDENHYKYSAETVCNNYTSKRNMKDLAEGMRTNLVDAPKDLVIRYSGVDTDAPLEAFNVMRKKIHEDKSLLRYYVKFITPVTDMLSEMSWHGCRINRETLKRNEQKALRLAAKAGHKALRHVDGRLIDKYGRDLDVLSKPDFVRDVVFRSKYGYRKKPLPIYLTPKTKQPQANEDHLKNFIDLPFVEHYLEWAKLNTLLKNFLTGFWKYIYPDGRIYPSTHLLTVTGRTGMRQPPIHGTPRRSEYAHLVREIFEADPDWLFGGRDLSQSEMRIIGWLAGDQVIMDALRQGIDLHTKTASITTGKNISDITEKERDDAKPSNFGFIYGMMSETFRRQIRDDYGIKITKAQGERKRAQFFSKPNGYWKLLVYHAQQIHLARRDGYVRCILGRKRRLPLVHSKNWGESSRAERQAINSPTQNLSSDLGLLGMALYHQEIKTNIKLKGKTRLQWFIHDNDMFQAKEKVMPLAMDTLKDCMEVRTKEYIKKYFKIDLAYPIESDGKIGNPWSDMKKVR